MNYRETVMHSSSMRVEQTSALFIGDSSVFLLAHRKLADGAIQNRPQVVVDCGGYFDPHALYREARWIEPAPGPVLDRVQVARAFTAYQEMTLLIRLWRQFGSDHHVFLLNPLHPLGDPDLPEMDRSWLFQRLRKAILRFRGAGYLLTIFQTTQAMTASMEPGLIFGWPCYRVRNGKIEGAGNGKKRLTLFPGGGSGGKELRRIPSQPDQGRQGTHRQTI